ncbi:hypothetical protein JGK46_002435 [Aeromonas bestiarum]|nr:hypothetical protein [Aeromonas bestiarum]
MKVEVMDPTKQVVDILCDVCGCSTRTSCGTQEYGTLEANWGYSSVHHHGERYQMYLCENCFFQTLVNLRQEHRLQNMFSEDYQPADPDTFGRVKENKEII